MLNEFCRLRILFILTFHFLQEYRQLYYQFHAFKERRWRTSNRTKVPTIVLK